MNPPPQPVFDRERLAAGLRWLSERGVFIGTSSWKYEGWLGQLYTTERYLTRGKLSHAKLERDCLGEYAEAFDTVCVDAGYYRFPSPKWLQQFMETTPDRFRFSFKVTDDITARTFPNLPRHGDRAGQRNEHFLSADLFKRAFLHALAPWHQKTGVLIFEFSHFHPRDFERGRDFVGALDEFFGALPKGWRYAVEVRNPSLLQPDYFAMLQTHGVAHVFNQWSRMPDIAEQIKLEGSTDCADFTCARLLLKHGRSYEDAVASFSPYAALKETHETARATAVALARSALDPVGGPKHRRAFMYVNNRLEGNALLTIAAIVARIAPESPLPSADPAGDKPPLNLT